MKNLISINDGNRKFTPRTVSCHDQQAPFRENEQTILGITHNDHHVSHISDGFVHMVLEVMIQVTGITTTGTPAAFTDTNHLCKAFVGFKSSNQIFRQMWIRSRNQGTGYEQSEMIREGFAMSHSMDYNTKKSKKYTHTLYDNVAKFNENVCGVYINLEDFKDGVPHPVEIHLVCPFDDLAALQAFAFYPNAIVGDIELQFYVGHEGLVWAPVDPERVLDIKRELQGVAIDAVFPVGVPKNISHQFAQINNPLQAPITFAVAAATPYTITMTTGPVHVNCTGLRVLMCEANMSGFQVKQSTLNGIHSLFSEPVYIPAEYLEYNAFPTPPNENGLRSTQNTALNNVKDIYVMFPKRTNDYTCFDNPCIDQFCIRAMGIQFPEKVVSTLGARFYQLTLNASDLGGVLRPTTEFIDSYTQEKNGDDSDHPLYTSLHDMQTH
jgi:hypothetical protein